jgi:hypothetical protein
MRATDLYTRASIYRDGEQIDAGSLLGMGLKLAEKGAEASGFYLHSDALGTLNGETGRKIGALVSGLTFPD